MIRGIENDVVVQEQVLGITRSEHIGDRLDGGSTADLLESGQCCCCFGNRLAGMLFEEQCLTVEIGFAYTITVEDGEFSDPSANQCLCQWGADSAASNQQDSQLTPALIKICATTGFLLAIVSVQESTPGLKPTGQGQSPPPSVKHL